MSDKNKTTPAPNADKGTSKAKTGDATATAEGDRKKRTQQSQGAKMKTAEGMLGAISSGKFGLESVSSDGKHLILKNTEKGTLTVKPKPDGFDAMISTKIAELKATLESLEKLAPKPEAPKA